MSMASRCWVVVSLVVIAGTGGRGGWAEEMDVDLSAAGASEKWMLMEGASIEDGELALGKNLRGTGPRRP